MNITKLVQSPAAIVFALAAAFFAGQHYLRAQGSLTPPAGAPGPTMKSLDQIEPRTALPGGTATINITASGSYYLAGNLAVTTGNGIVISASNVTLDLNGFTISSSAATAEGAGILLATNMYAIHILNGHIQGTTTYNGSVYSGGGFLDGISSLGASLGWRVTGVSVVGVSRRGIYDIQNAAIVDSCEVLICGAVGIQAGIVSRCRTQQCGSTGIFGQSTSDCVALANNNSTCIFAETAANCFADNTLSGAGISAKTAFNCAGSSNTGIGIAANSAQNCRGVALGLGGVGIDAFVVANCSGRSNSGNGISASTVTGSHGQSEVNRGITADVVTSSWGTCLGGGSFGIVANHIGSTSYGYSLNGTGLSASIANTCRGVNQLGAALNATFKYDMP